MPTRIQVSWGCSPGWDVPKDVVLVSEGTTGAGGAGCPAGHPQKLTGRQESTLPCLNPHTHRNAVAVWKGIIEGTAHAGQVRVTSSESYRTLATEAARTARLSKEQMLKKVPGRGHVPRARAVGTAVPPKADTPCRASSSCKRRRRSCWRR